MVGCTFITDGFSTDNQITYPDVFLQRPSRPDRYEFLYTKSNQVTISLDADDVTTGVKDIETRNINITRTEVGETEEKFNFIPLEYTESFLWALQEDEVIKKVEVKLRD